MYVREEHIDQAVDAMIEITYLTRNHKPKFPESFELLEIEADPAKVLIKVIERQILDGFHNLEDGLAFMLVAGVIAARKAQGEADE